jgi:hypothetical protein
MPCDTIRLPQQTISQRKEEIKTTVQKLAEALVRGSVKAKVGPQGAIAFVGWTERNRITDNCAYRRIMATGSAAAKLAIIKAEQLAGRTVDRRVVAQGVHLHGDHWHNHKG